MKKNPMKPRAKMAKLVVTTWAACFAWQKPVSTSAKPACMKMTRTAPITTHNRLMFCASVTTGSASSCAKAMVGKSAAPARPMPAAVMIRRARLGTVSSNR